MIINKTEFLIGADPECFIREIRTGKLVSAHGMLPGTKEEPYPVPKGAVQIDGMAAEFNIDPAKDEDEFVLNVTSVLNTIREMIGDKYELVFTPTAHFGKELIDAQPQEAKELGCDPDFNAWTGEENPVPNAELPFRTAAGHIHIGWTSGQDPHNKQHFEICRHVIRELDYGTLPTVLIDTDSTRRTLYGRAGAFRPKPYGVEYRTPSNFWLQSEATLRLMYKSVTKTLKRLIEKGCGINGSTEAGSMFHLDITRTYNTYHKKDNEVFAEHYDKADLLWIASRFRCKAALMDILAKKESKRVGGLHV